MIYLCNKIYLYFALGKAFEDVKQYKDVFNFIKTEIN